MSQANIVQNKIEKIRQCNTAITGIADLLIKLQIDSGCDNEIPETIKNGFIRGSLLAALQIAAEASIREADWLEKEHMRHMDSEQTETLP